jgi:putative ABC transport system ATP-binding protein
LNAIEIKDLRFAYSHGPEILEMPEFHVRQREKVFLFGPSGSGKTTLLSIITGILSARSGRVSVLGEDLTRLSASARDRLRGTRMGYIFQMFNLLPYLSVIDNILLPCKMNPHRAERVGADVEAEAWIIAEHLGIAEHAHKKPSDLSVGQQQRVAAARALLGNPDLIIADEPTSALDTDHRESFLELLFTNTRKTGAAVLFVSHDRSLARLFDRSISLPDLNLAAPSVSPAIKKPATKVTRTSSGKRVQKK